MGWASAGEIFDPVAAALIEAGASDDLKRRVGAVIENYGSEVNGLIGVTEDDTEWTLTCDGRQGCGQIDTRPLTVAGHDELVRAWADHDENQHDGDGEVPDWMLLADEEASR